MIDVQPDKIDLKNIHIPHRITFINLIGEHQNDDVSSSYANPKQSYD
jgi:hypothetical protein